MLEVAVLYGFDLSQVFTPIILRLYQPHSLCEKGATKAAAKAALYVFLLPPLREGRPARPANTGRWSNFYSRPYARGDMKSGTIRVLIGSFLLAPLREGRQQFFTKPQVDLYDKLLKIHIFKLTLSVYSSIHLKTLTITLLGLHEPPGKMCTGRVGVRK